MRKRSMFFISILILLTLSSCDMKEQPSQQKTAEVNDEEKQADIATDEKIELTLWSWYDSGWEHSASEFQKIYPNVEIKVKAFPYGTYEDEYKNALIKGKVPDIMTFDSDQFKNFKAISGLEDLSKAPYHAEEFKKDFSPSLWQMGEYADGEKFIGLPFTENPRVTFYRKDIMEKYGFPSEPEELAAYMENPDNWFKIAETLKKDGIWVMQWPNELMNLYESQSAFFSNDYVFNRNNDIFRKAITLSQRAYQAELAAYYDIYMPEGEQALRDGKIAMLYQGTYVTDELKTFVPEQRDLWRVTRLPFNVYGLGNSTLFSIPTDSNYKEVAWEFIKFYTMDLMKRGSTNAVPAYLPARGNPYNLNFENSYLGGQKTQQLYESLMEQTEVPFFTPLDEAAEKIWDENIDSGIQWNIDPSEILNKVTEDINGKLEQEQRILKEAIKK